MSIPSNVIDLGERRPAVRPADCIAGEHSGRPAGYTRRKCRCAVCRAANTRYHADLRKRRRAAHTAPASGGAMVAELVVGEDGSEHTSNVDLPCPRHDELVDAMCWCDTRVVSVPMTDVWAGVTVSCGRPACTDPRAVPVRSAAARVVVCAA